MTILHQLIFGQNSDPFISSIDCVIIIQFVDCNKGTIEVPECNELDIHRFGESDFLINDARSLLLSQYLGFDGEFDTHMLILCGGGIGIHVDASIARHDFTSVLAYLDERCFCNIIC